MSEAPDRIWLHRRDPEDGFGAESTWSEDQIEDWDVEYIRADIHDRRADRLRAELAEREAELERMRDALQGADAALKRLADEQPRISAEQPRTDAEWRAADRKKRINDLAARYAGDMVHAYIHDGVDVWATNCVTAARALAAAVVEAEE